MSVGAGVNERLAALTAAGTSVWLDQIRRSLITCGELERLERELSLRGVTSNPAIFEKAILGSTDYDEQIAELAAKGLSAREIYDEIAILDVQLACDVLRPVWDEAGHARRLRLARGRAGASRTTPRPRSSRRTSTGSASTARTC